MKLYHSQSGDLVSLGNFADLVKRKWGHLGVYLDRSEPRSDRCHIGPNRWRLKASHLIVAEHTGGIILGFRHPSGHHTWDMAWIAEDASEFLRADMAIPAKRHLSIGFHGDGIDARKVRGPVPIASPPKTHCLILAVPGSRSGGIVPSPPWPLPAAGAPGRLG